MNAMIKILNIFSFTHKLGNAVLSNFVQTEDYFHREKYANSRLLIAN